MNISWLLILLGYLLGSVPTAYIAGQIFRGQDIRHMGDGNVGAANAFRELNPAVGIVVGLIDAGKGAITILVTRDVGAPLPIVLLTGAATILGHNFPVFLGFRGGRGASATIGEFLVLTPIPLLIASAPALLTLFLSQNVVLASAVLFIPMVIVSWISGVPGMLIGYSIAVLLIVAFTHLLRVRLTPVRVAAKEDKEEI